MSHHPERKIKSCLNCGTTVFGRYCHVCGQENIEPTESFWGLLKHFFYDITHFDGNFFSSLKYLLFSPGFLSAEYMKGRRVRYLHPVRMYIFTSALFFLIFFSIYHLGREDVEKTTNPAVKEAAREISTDSALRSKDIAVLPFPERDEGSALSAADSSGKVTKKAERRKLTPPNESVTYLSREAYDSAQAALPPAKRDGWMKRFWQRKFIQIDRNSADDLSGYTAAVLSRLFHSLPQLLFVSLPLFALMLKIIYMRRKDFYYADHAIFSIHLYVFGFIVILMVLLLTRLQQWLHWGWLSVLSTLFLLYAVVYSFVALKLFYRQGFAKTLAKYILLFVLAAFVIIVLFMLFLLLSLFQT